MLRLDASALDYSILAIYFLVVLGIGAVARLSVKTDIDFFLGVGLTRKEEADAYHDPADDVWYRSPWLLGAGAIVLIVALNIIFI